MDDLLLNVFDVNFNRLGVIDSYIEVEFEHNYHKHSELVMTVDATDENVRLLISDEMRILTKSDDVNRGYLIQTVEYTDEKAETIDVIAYSLSVMLSWRIIMGQQKYGGNIESIIKNFVNQNAINTSSKRIIPKLVLGVNEGIKITSIESYVNTQLDESLWEICEKFDMSFEILMNHDAKKFVFSTYQGVDRSAKQMINPHIIFSKDFENILKQNFVSDTSNLKTTAIVYNEDEIEYSFYDPSTDKEVKFKYPYNTTITVNDLSGYNRKEIFVKSNARRKYTENDIEITIPEGEFLNILQEDGKVVLAEKIEISAFESDVDPFTNFVFGEDYSLGDRVSIRNEKLKLVIHPRISQAKETYNSRGYLLKLAFGTNVPTFLDKLKKEVKRK